MSNDKDLRTSDEDEFALRLFRLMREKFQAYKPSPAVVRASNKRCSGHLDRFWTRAEAQGAALGCPNIVRQTNWLKQFNDRVFAYRKDPQKDDTAIVQYLDADSDNDLDVKKLTRLFWKRNYTPTLMYPGFEAFIDTTTQRGILATLLLLPGMLVGQFIGTVYPEPIKTAKKKLSKLEELYLIEVSYAGNLYTINPVISVNEHGLPKVEAAP